MHAVLVVLWVVLPIVYIVSVLVYFVREVRKAPAGADRATKWAEFPKYLATVTAVTALLAGAGQAITAAVKFGDDYAHTTNVQRLEALNRAAMFPKEADVMVRVLEISTLLDTLRSDKESGDAVALMLVQFIRSKQSIDGNRAALNKLIAEDVQAAIRVLGAANLATPDHKRHFNFRRLSLVGADFSSGDFSGSVFDESDLRFTSFRDSHLEGARFISANFDYWCVEWAQNFDLSTVDPNDLFKSAAADWYPDKVQATFANASANGAEFYSANLIGVDFSNAKLNGAKFGSADLTFANFQGEHSEYQLPELAQGCRSGPVRPDAIAPQLRQCSGPPAPRGKEDIWYDASAAPRSASELVRLFKYQ